MSASTQDRGPLEGLVAYAQLVVFGYDQVLTKAPLAPADRPLLERLSADASQAVTALAGAVELVGGQVPPRPNAAAAPPPADPSRRGWLRELIAAEEDAVTAYYTGLQNMVGARHLAGSAAFMAQTGRRLVALRRLAGEPVLPRAFETGGA